MTSIHYLTGWTVDARQKILDKKLSSWKKGPVLHLVPARGRVIELESDNRFWPKKRQDTLIGLIYRIFEEHIRPRQFSDRRLIDDNIRSIFVRKAIEKRSGQPDGLACFNRLLQDPDNDFPGISGSISSFFSQLVQNDYQDRFVNDIQGRIIKAEGNGDFPGEEVYALESDLAWIFGDFEEIKREIRAYDQDDVLCSVRDFLRLPDSARHVRENEVIIFDGFIHLSRIEEDILYHLFSNVKEVWWLLDYDGRKDDPVNEFRESCCRGKDRRSGMEAYRIFSSMASFMKRLEADGFETVTEKSGEALFLNPVAQGLYLDGNLRKTPTNSLRIRSFPGKVEEVRGMASEIKRLIRDDSLDVSRDLGRIRIVFPELIEYSPLISEIFREYGIPFSLTSGLPLILHPLSNVFLLIFKLPLNRFERGDVCSLFSSGLIRKKVTSSPYFPGERILELLENDLLAGDEGTDLKSLITEYPGDNIRSCVLDIGFIDRTARRCGLRNLDDNEDGPDKCILNVKNYYNGISARTSDARERAGLKREYYRFVIQHTLLSDCLKPFKALADQDGPHGIEKAFYGLLNELGLPQHLLDNSGIMDSCECRYDMDSVRRDVKAYTVLTDLISESASEIMIDSELFRTGKGGNILSRFYRVFRSRLEKTCLLDEEDPNVIRVSQWLEVRGRAFDYVFAGGLTDKGFPLKEEADFICPETCKNFFRAPDSIDMSRYLFSHLLRNNRRGIYLSYPVYAEGKEVRPSSVFTDIDYMKYADPAPVHEDGTAETSLTWQDSPYISSSLEMLDAGVIKGGCRGNTKSEAISCLVNVIIKNPCLLEGVLRALKAAGSRQALNGLFEYDGLVKSAGRFEVFLRSKKDAFSASQLDALANCPMRYLFESIYGLKIMEAAGPEASPMDMGFHIHAVLRTFFRRLAGKGINVYDMGISNAFSQVGSDAEEYFRSIPFLESIEFFDQQKQEFLAGLDQGISGDSSDIQTREGALALLLRFEEECFRNRKPEGIEYEFGFNGLSSLRMGRVRLRGIIDRFDRDLDDKGLLHIYDYKTGVIPSYLLIKKGLSFQLPVYIKALKTCLNAEKVTASLYSLKRDNLLNKSPLGQYISDHAGGAAGIDISGISLFDRYTDNLMDLLEKGRFHHSADMIKCEYCDFRYACHRDERRMGHLVASAVDHGIYSGMRNLDAWKEAETFTGELKKIREKMDKAFNLGTAAGRRKSHYHRRSRWLD